MSDFEAAQTKIGRRSPETFIQTRRRLARNSNPIDPDFFTAAKTARSEKLFKYLDYPINGKISDLLYLLNLTLILCLFLPFSERFGFTYRQNRKIAF